MSHNFSLGIVVSRCLIGQQKLTLILLLVEKEARISRLGVLNKRTWLHNEKIIIVYNEYFLENKI